ncbi:hypothetical protein M0812_03063 [Anaeramoeba flamelloides]|uniref:YhhN-like protein n=1 Tax=Anaeramoeba flamelloides TaxID=1746091 RepID=A0AAV7YNK5_9EUKA|nr:hypothetical protein M0812_03063 [Anaeramoeba flamelloides]
MNFQPILLFLITLFTLYGSFTKHVYVWNEWVWIYMKPTITILVIIYAFLRPVSKATVNYKRLVIVGLVFSLGGDVFLQYGFFIYGLVSFLIAHIFYTIAYFSGIKLKFSAIGIMMFAIPLAGFLFYLTPYLPEDKKIPVYCYCFVIMLMGVASYERNRILKSGPTKKLLFGAIFFIISDILLAIALFAHPISYLRFFNYCTYILGQWGISASIDLDQLPKDSDKGEKQSSNQKKPKKDLKKKNNKRTRKEK